MGEGLVLLSQGLREGYRSVVAKVHGGARRARNFTAGLVPVEWSPPPTYMTRAIVFHKVYSHAATILKKVVDTQRSEPCTLMVQEERGVPEELSDAVSAGNMAVTPLNIPVKPSPNGLAGREGRA